MCETILVCCCALSYTSLASKLGDAPVAVSIAHSQHCSTCDAYSDPVRNCLQPPSHLLAVHLCHGTSLVRVLGLWELQQDLHALQLVSRLRVACNPSEQHRPWHKAHGTLYVQAKPTTNNPQAVFTSPTRAGAADAMLSRPKLAWQLAVRISWCGCPKATSAHLLHHQSAWRRRQSGSASGVLPACAAPAQHGTWGHPAVMQLAGTSMAPF